MEEIGYLKYDGEAVREGIIDARSAGTALVSFDQTIRYFNAKQSPEFAKIDYDIPVRIENGSWIAVLLVGAMIVGGGFATGYAKKAGEKMAENDFSDFGFTDVFRKSTDALRQLFRLAKHTRKVRGWDLRNVEFRENNTLIGIPNADGEKVFVDYEYLKWFRNIPSSLLEKLVEPVREERTLSIGVRQKDGEILEERVGYGERTIFSISEDDIESEDILFPELKHGDMVRLEGKLTRGNESSNTIGFEYKQHILNCIPEEGTIVRFKPALFTKCVLEGFVTRHNHSPVLLDRRPTLIVTGIFTDDSSSDQDDLLGG